MNTRSSPKVEVKNLIHQYNGKTVLSMEQHSFDESEIHAVLGQNGSGKTTLLNIIGLLLKPTSGTLLFDGRDVYSDPNAISELRPHLTTVIQNPVLFDTTVEKNIEFGLKIRGVSKEQRTPIVDECLEMVRLEGFQKRKARELSGGEAQRIAIARALAIKPEVLLLDEFTSNVDEKSIEVLEDVITTVNKSYGSTIFLVTHDTNQAYRLADTVINLFDGNVVKPSLENLFRGTLKKINDLWLFDTGKMKMEVITQRSGETAYAAVDPRDIVVSLKPLTSSARNTFKGTIVKIIGDGASVLLGINAGEDFTVKVTRDSLLEMKITVGSDVYLTFKSTAVQVF
jgi:tungstate transport system ATP-binding protein